MGNSYFQFKQFRIEQDRCAMKVCTDACLFGAWVPLTGSEQHILDIGTGTGLLALILAQRSHASIDAVEIDPEAARQASENIACSPWPERVRVFSADIREYEGKTGYDLIISNPPFYENSLASTDTREKLAKHGFGLDQLFGSVERLALHSTRLALLLPFYRKAEALELAQTWGWHLHESMDVRNRPADPAFRFMALWGKKPAPEVIRQELSIYQKHREYSPEFTERLKHLYL